MSSYKVKTNDLTVTTLQRRRGPKILCCGGGGGLETHAPVNSSFTDWTNSDFQILVSIKPYYVNLYIAQT